MGHSVKTLGSTYVGAQTGDEHTAHFVEVVRRVGASRASLRREVKVHLVLSERVHAACVGADGVVLRRSWACASRRSDTLRPAPLGPGYYSPELDAASNSSSG